ncbi:MAG: beta-galactosidase [Tannerella sp.]|jgi:hypothetical protein|nr:beta-galactosidase [Tannerella sp.]
MENMKQITGLFLLSFILCCPACQPERNGYGQVHQFDLQEIAKTTLLTHEWLKSPDFNGKCLSVTVAENRNELVLTGGEDAIDWPAAKYLVCEVWHDNPYSLLLTLQFFRKTGRESTVARQGVETAAAAAPAAGPRLSCTIGILPKLKTKMIFPLSHLDGQQIFLERRPRQLKGTVSGRRIDPADVGRVSIRITPAMQPDFLSRVQISAVYLSDKLPDPYEKPAYATVDSFGQWTARDWPGKIHSADELKAAMDQTHKAAQASGFPDEWSRYGGWKQLPFKAKGFFYTHHDGKRWWLVDPDGYAFLSAGIDCVRSNASGVLSGQKELFGWLPPEKDSVFAGAYSAGRLQQVDFLKANLMRIYGAGWKKEWEETTAGLMKRWRVNTVANWSDSGMARRNKMPYVLNMENFPGTPVKLYRDFPDVFDPVYRQEAQRFAQQLAPLKDDPYLIGYFLQNEPQWAFGDNSPAFEMFAVPTPSYSKKEMARWLQKKYGNIQTFNDSWKQNLEDFSALESLVLKDRPSDAAWDDCTEFSGILVDRYIETVCNEVKKVDSRHLNLGMRYAWISSDLCYRAGAWFDVFSINGYSNPAPPSTAEIARRSGKPVIIGEWHFGSAIDRGLPATGIQGAESQTARGQAYRYYFEQGIARPELIGIHWFQWNDQPIFGRFDGENYNIGFLDVCMQPYAELTGQATLSHERMYRVAAGSEEPYAVKIRKVPQIYY